MKFDPTKDDELTRSIRMDDYYDKDTNDISVAFELPGLQKDDVSIDVHNINGVLTVSGGNRASSELSEGGYVVRERRYGKFTRSLALPQGLKVEFRICHPPDKLLMTSSTI